MGKGARPLNFLLCGVSEVLFVVFREFLDHLAVDTRRNKLLKDVIAFG